MSVEDGNDVGSIPLTLLSPLDREQSEEVLSHDDMAWLDSCLTRDPEVLESGWDAMKLALLESLESLPAGSYNNQTEDNEVNTIMICPAEESEITPFRETVDNSGLMMSFLTEEEGKDTEDSPANESSEAEGPVITPFLPNYKEFRDEMGEESADVNPGFNLETMDDEPTGEDIFKVWELEIPEEDDEFAKELNKALAASEQSSVESSLPNSEDYSGLRKGGDESSIDGLVAGIASLSLDPDT